MEYEVRRITKLMRFDVNRKIKQIYDFSKKDYYVDTDGNLYHRREKLVDIKNNFGYITNTIKDNDGVARTFSRQQIVAQTFLLDSFEEGMTVDHINRVRHDNRLENLRWSTAKQQIHNQTRKIHRVNISNFDYQPFQALIKDQKIYFINNPVPKFDKVKYKYLNLLYKIHKYMLDGDESDLDSILLSYVENNKYIKFKDKSEFYDYFYPNIRQYYSDKSKEIAIQSTTELVDVAEFEKVFKDKKYVKKEFKEYCINKFNLKNEVFKNKESINLFLEKIGFKIWHKRTGDYIIKIDDSNN